MQPRATVGILLAAGSGQRFDPSGVRNKLLAPLAHGVPVGLQSATNLCQALDKVIVVVQSEELAVHFQSVACRTLVFLDAKLGMGATLAFAVSNAISEFDPDSLIVALADMPFVQLPTFQKVLAMLDSGSEIVQPVFAQQGGHPVGFGRRHFAALKALSGDQGARQLLREFPVTQVLVDDPGIILDIDYPTDLHPDQQ